jgi:hypothetical protein
MEARFKYCGQKYYQIMRSAVMTRKYTYNSEGKVSGVSWKAVPPAEDCSWIFCEGENHDELILTDPEEIAAMREYIKTAHRFKEISDENATEKEYGVTEYRLNDGVPSGTMLTSVMCEGHSVDDNKVMYFDMGDDARSYITDDPQIIDMIDRYLANTQNPFFYKVTD